MANFSKSKEEVCDLSALIKNVTYISLCLYNDLEQRYDPLLSFVSLLTKVLGVDLTFKLTFEQVY